jgi:putative addiction module antidote
MARKLKLTAIGDSVGVILPQEILDKLHVGKGDELVVRETEEGITLAPSDPGFSDHMRVAEKVMHEDRELLRKLAE